MVARGLWPVLAAVVLLSGCGSGEPPPAAERTPAADVASLRPPVEPVASASADPTPEPSDSATPTPVASPSLTPAVSYPPRDECAKLPGFAAFRAKLFAAAKAKDAEALAALADPAIHLDFGGGAGTDELKKRLADPKAPLWTEIAQLATLGCAADRGVATLPWIFSRLPEGFDDASTAMYGTGQILPLRAGPSAASRLLAHLTWPVVELEGAGFDPKAAYAKVRLSDGTVGYMETAKLRSLLDYRLIADRQGNEWRITALIAGD